MKRDDVAFWRALRRELELKRASQGPFDPHDLMVCAQLIEFCDGQVTRLVRDKLTGENDAQLSDWTDGVGYGRPGCAGNGTR